MVSRFLYQRRKEYAGQINLYNDKGEKNGFWREQNNYRITELYYQNGIEDGLCRIYNIKGKLQYMGYYKKGEMSDIWYDFGDYVSAVNTIRSRGKGYYQQMCVERAHNLFEKDKNIEQYIELFNILNVNS